MGYELRVVREAPLAPADLAKAIAPAGFQLRGSEEILAGDHRVGTWHGQIVGEPDSDWHLAQLLRLAAAVGGRLVGEDGESYGVRDGVIEVVADGVATEVGKFDQIVEAGPASW
ncbi:MAG: hypothetical protein HOY71_47840 [Nonomuraea sp.]|nr:hypothetical protein [Nonomuraea sp.]